jgi:hypothetical protein
MKKVAGGEGSGGYGLSEQRLKLNTFQSPYAAAAKSGL